MYKEKMRSIPLNKSFKIAKKWRKSWQEQLQTTATLRNLFQML